MFLVLFRRLRLAFYMLISSSQPAKPDVRFFQFWIPLVMKCTRRTFSTEAHALLFLRSTGLKLPIPRVIDTFVLDGYTYTVMSRMKGVPLLDVHRDNWNNPEHQIPISYDAISTAVRDVVEQLWTLEQPLKDKGKVMLSASGHGLPDPTQFFDSHMDPRPSVLDLYYYLTPHLDTTSRPKWTASHLLQAHPEPMQAVLRDEVAWVHSDLKMHNIMIDPETGEFVGILDWEDSGWRPKHWQLFPLRHYGPATLGPFANCFRGMRFPDQTEEAYEMMFKLLYHLPC
ncbi:kinase-like protein [Rhodocollybia butyracea]|uniref:Kinase-like protein n=1 Tax=Rhodocollybia butyracea TaxID=206335 RepID=A0A9P5PSL5_9AGAR|nr:kinase-like protein [Rhodocollybia butyracea]